MQKSTLEQGYILAIFGLSTLNLPPYSGSKPLDKFWSVVLYISQDRLTALATNPQISVND